jgi:endoglucanase
MPCVIARYAFPRRSRSAARPLTGLACALVLAAGAAGCGSSPAAPAAARRPASSFLSGYEQPDGQMVRRDQGSDTVSEGQAYGMLLAEVSGNLAAFRRIWAWTRRHLQLRSGLLAFHADAAGRVIGREPASDADLIIAWALLRYRGTGAAGYHRQGRRVAAAILAGEVTRTPGGTPVLTAGPWATGRPASLDPSYWSLAALQGIAQLTGQPEWRSLAAGAVAVTRELTRGGRLLPPDWAKLTAAGAVQPEPAPDGSQPQPQYGPDAQRTVVWLAASCSPRARALAGRWWPLLRPGDRAQALSLRLNGTVLNAAAAPLALVAAAAAAKAAGHVPAARQLLQRAAAQQRRQPSYYGGAWLALGRALLTSRALGTC